MRGKRILLCVFVWIISMLMSGCEIESDTQFQEITESDLEEQGNTEEAEVVSEKDVIFVHVCGQIEHPGVYELPTGSRVYEAIRAAGGINKNALADGINQAAVLEDGQQVYIPSKEEVENQVKADGKDGSSKVNINRASKEELMTLPGIGESKADAIIKYRNDKGNFKSIEEIMEIEGIKEGVFHKIEDQITAL